MLTPSMLFPCLSRGSIISIGLPLFLLKPRTPALVKIPGTLSQFDVWHGCMLLSYSVRFGVAMCPPEMP